MLSLGFRSWLGAMPAAVVALAGLAAFLPAHAAPNEPLQEQNLYNYGTSKPGNSLMDVTNPMELMNRLRNSSAMDNATNPKDAIDAALRQFEQPSAPAGKVVPVKP